jgi:hypothetical protein
MLRILINRTKNIKTVKKTQRALLEASSEVDLEASTQSTK